ncbi:rhamnogalacturonan acetylesterase [Algoriphagus aestuariicola]|uniref:Rhamnogalacturonan acetylesterase n=1 Tax=Algoriphagus aestuariicola TaxID=1852016 RepID=A0ABS3BUW3_9BACT|nr:rhamnogalacturonan acetylesterase [Algoriphagus aestuariicola]MBN7803057.1 rhamnogalacturonan acetylesterase [Algoriphagus aestuariicola]
MHFLRKNRFNLLLTVLVLVTSAFISPRDVTTIYLIGDSTMADYSTYEGEDYLNKRYPLMGWGQVFQELFDPASISSLKHLIQTDSVLVDDRARGGRSTRTFFEEGRWSAVYRDLRPGDLVLMQFGHNDAAKDKTERYVATEGYKEYIRLFVTQTREKGAIPIVLTPVNRNYPWKDGKLGNVHGEYHTAAVDVAKELDAFLIDLTQRSMDAFTEKGQDYVSVHYFMNFEPGVYPNYPEGSKDNTHFLPEGAKAVAQLVLEGMQELN